MRRSIGADSLGYVSLESLIAASEQPPSRLCTACFDGSYPIPLPPSKFMGKHVLDGLDAVMRSSTGDTGPELHVGAATEDVRHRP